MQDADALRPRSLRRLKPQTYHAVPKQANPGGAASDKVVVIMPSVRRAATSLENRGDAAAFDADRPRRRAAAFDADVPRRDASRPRRGCSVETGVRRRYYATAGGDSGHSALESRRAYLRKTVESLKPTFPKYTVCVATKPDYEYVTTEPGLDFYDVKSYFDLPKPSRLGFATIHTAQQALLHDPKWASFEYVAAPRGSLDPFSRARVAAAPRAPRGYSLGDGSSRRRRGRRAVIGDGSRRRRGRRAERRTTSNLVRSNRSSTRRATRSST